jgi:CubicO group peptidase (beta-lactamase class C family)
VLTIGGLLAAPAIGIAGEAAAEGRAQEQALTDAISLLDVWIGEQLAYNAIPGLAIAVVRDQEVVWSAGYGFRDLETHEPITPATPFRIGSVSKIFTSTAIMQLRDQGKLRLDEPVSTYLPWFSVQDDFDDAPVITVKNLLTHTAGLPREGAFPYWTTHDFPTRDQLKATVPGQSAVFPPDVTYKYSNLGIALLGEIVAAVSDEEYATYIEKNIFVPLRMDSSTVFPSQELQARMATPYMIKKPDGSRDIHDYYSTRAIAPAAEIVSTVEDMAKFAALHLHESSEHHMQKILKASTAREMQRPHWVYPSWSGGRGLGFGISRRDGTTIVSHGGWIGGNRAHLLLVPSEKIAVLAMTNADDASPYTFSYEAYDLLGPVIAKADRKEAPESTFDPTWERFTGVYSDPWGWKEEVMVLDGKLVMYSYSYPPEENVDSGVTPLTWIEGHRFKRPDGEFVTFELAEDGSVEHIQKRYDYLFPVEGRPVEGRPVEE